MNEQVLEWIGHIASGIILVSLLMNSIVKLRWINLVGAIVFAFYGFVLGLWPVAIMNVGIIFIDVYYLAKIYLSNDYFTIMEIDQNSQYYRSFVSFYKDDIDFFCTDDIVDPDKSDVALYILRNMEIAGVFVATKAGEGELEILLDYAIPRYRDFKLGKHLFDAKQQDFKELGFTKFKATSYNEAHTKYLKRMGFVPEGDVFTKTI